MGLKVIALRELTHSTERYDTAQHRTAGVSSMALVFSAISKLILQQLCVVRADWERFIEYTSLLAVIEDLCLCIDSSAQCDNVTSSFYHQSQAG